MNLAQAHFASGHLLDAPGDAVAGSAHRLERAGGSEGQVPCGGLSGLRHVYFDMSIMVTRRQAKSAAGGASDTIFGPTSVRSTRREVISIALDEDHRDLWPSRGSR
jgi:hypothetical protein